MWRSERRGGKYSRGDDDNDNDNDGDNGNDDDNDDDDNDDDDDGDVPSPARLPGSVCASAGGRLRLLGEGVSASGGQVLEQIEVKILIK